MTKADLIDLAKATAERHQLDPALVCAVVEQESDWNEVAYRDEPAFEKRYVDPKHLDSQETYLRSCSYGLMQLMGECAREMGFATDLTDLFDPATNLDWGCRLLSLKLKAAHGDKWKALLIWNGGNNHGYPGEVIARMEKYR